MQKCGIVKNLTVQRLKVRSTFHVRPRTIHVVAFPISPESGILEVVIKLPVFQIFCAQYPMPSTGIHKVLVGNGSGSAILTDPRGRYGSALHQNLRAVFKRWSCSIGGLLKRDRVRLCLGKDMCAAAAGVPQKEIIKLRPDQVPRISIGPTCLKEVGVFAMLASIMSPQLILARKEK